MIKINASEVAEVVTFLFIQWYESGQLPIDWRNAHVVPVIKKGEKHDPFIIDLCPLLLCYVITMEHITYENIVHHLEDNNSLFVKQHGYRKNHSCETQLILTVEDQAISKAFYKVPHQCLINKLHFYGIQGSTLACIKSWLTSRSQCHVDVVISGVPQGTVVGPLMFLWFIYDMQDDLHVVQYPSKVSWQSLVSWSSRLETWFSILKTFDNGVLSLNDRGSSFEFWGEKYYELVVYTYLLF